MRVLYSLAIVASFAEAGSGEAKYLRFKKIAGKEQQLKSKVKDISDRKYKELI